MVEMEGDPCPLFEQAAILTGASSATDDDFPESLGATHGTMASP